MRTQGMFRIRHVAVAVMAGLALAGTASATALASPAPGAGIEAQRTEITNRINARLTKLDALTATLNAAQHGTAAHKSTLTDLITSDRSGLTALRTKVAAETTGEALRADAKTMVEGYRIFILASPQVRLTIASDLETAAIGRLTTAADTLAGKIAAAQHAGKDMAKAEAALNDLRAKLTSAGNAIAGQVDALLAVKPGPDANAIRAKVISVRQSVHTARTDLKAAAANAKSIRAQL